MSLWRQDTQVVASYLQSPQSAKKLTLSLPTSTLLAAEVRGQPSGLYHVHPHCPSCGPYSQLLSLGKHIKKNASLPSKSLQRRKAPPSQNFGRKMPNSPKSSPPPRTLGKIPRPHSVLRFPSFPGRDRKEAYLE